MRLVVLPQAVRRVLPPLMNDFIALTKDVALVSVLAVGDVVNVARDAQSVTFNSSTIVAAAVFYIVFTLPPDLAARPDHRARPAAHGPRRGRGAVTAIRAEGLVKRFGANTVLARRRPRGARRRGRLRHRALGLGQVRRSCAASTCSSGPPRAASSWATDELTAPGRAG